MAYCRNCGAQINDSAAFCTNCGCTVNPADQYANNQFAGNQFNYNPYFRNVPINNSMATASMVLGILGVIFWISPYLGFPLNIVGLVLSVKSKNVSKTGKGTAGMVLTIIGLCLTVFMTIGYLSSSGSSSI